MNEYKTIEYLDPETGQVLTMQCCFSWKEVYSFIKSIEKRKWKVLKIEVKLKDGPDVPPISEQ